MQAYIESLNSAKDHNLDQELEYLDLKSGGSAEVKRKRISQFVLNTATATPSNLDSRLEILEKTNQTILDRLDHISKEVNTISLISTTGPPVKASPNNTGNGNLSALQSDLLNKLTKAYQDNVMLLEKTDRSTNELQNTLKETATLRRDLDEWQNSFFKGRDSEKLDKILNIVKQKPHIQSCPDKEMLSSNVTKPDLVARSPHDTRTNQDLPGSNSSTSQTRDSYRRPGFTKKPYKAKAARSKKKTPKSQKVVLLTDATMP